MFDLSTAGVMIHPQGGRRTFKTDESRFTREMIFTLRSSNGLAAR
jgi:hypothetical protein